MYASLAPIALTLATLLCVGWALVLVRVWRIVGALRRLPSTPPGADPPPRVTAVIAARNEEAGIEASLRSLLAQEGVQLDLIVVDDGSSDHTPAILKRLREEVGSRLLVLENKKLPPGWVAKNYALEMGQGRASGDWLLFSDADVLHGPRAVFNAVAAMERERLDHLAVCPRLEAGRLVEALVLPLFVLLTHFRFIDPRAAAPESPVGTGVGAFNLVRADAYRLRGTHARIRTSMIDDRALGTMMRDEGGRGSVMRAVAQVRLRPYRSIRELYDGMRKQVVATFHNSATLTMVMAFILLIGAFAPIGLLLTSVPLWLRGHGPWLALPAAGAIVLPLIALLKARTIVRFEPLAVVMYPFGAVVIAAATIHAAVVFGTRGTIEWRGRTYTRRELG